MFLPNYNSFFIHIPRCGGTSAEMLFFKLHNIKIETYRIHHHLSEQQKEYFCWGNKDVELQYGTQHISAYDCINTIKMKEYINSDYTFAIVREPFERFISAYYYNLKYKEVKTSLRSFIDLQLENNSKGMSIKSLYSHLIPQWKFICDSNKNIIVDDVFKIEELHIAEQSLSDRFKTHIKFEKYNSYTNYNDFLSGKFKGIKNKIYPTLKDDYDILGY